MDSDGPTTGKANASRYMQDAEVQSWIEKALARWRLWAVLLGVAIIGIYYLAGRSSDSAAPAMMAHPMVPVAAVPAKAGDLKQYISAIGTVTPYNTVTVKSRVDGELVKVNFTEGQIVKAGDLLAEIDPRPYQVQLTQAEGTLAKDLATLENNKILLARDKELYEQKVIARQDLDNQQALVGQFAGSIESDKGEVDNAKLQLTYSKITAPITGRSGCGWWTPGNIVHATDANGLRGDHATAADRGRSSVFRRTICRACRQQMKAGPQLPVTAYDRDLKTEAGERHAADDRQPDRSDDRHGASSRRRSRTRTTRCSRISSSMRGCWSKRCTDAILIPTAAIQRSPARIVRLRGEAGQDGGGARW